MDSKISKYTDEYLLSDIHIRTNQPCAIRVNGEIFTFSEDIITEKAFEEFLSKHLPNILFL